MKKSKLKYKSKPKSTSKPKDITKNDRIYLLRSYMEVRIIAILGDEVRKNEFIKLCQSSSLERTLSITDFQACK